MALSLENRRPEVGQAGLALCRRSPHLACMGFLASLGDKRQWGMGRRRVDSDKALSLVFDHLRPTCKNAKGLVAALPAYFTPTQAELTAKLATKAKLPWLGAVSTPLAVVLAAHLERPCVGRAMVVDVDDHALTWTAVEAADERAFILGTQVSPALNVLTWKRRLLDALADRCIRHSRRDPRESAQAEQFLYDQLDRVLDACWQGQAVEVVIRAPTWFQNLALRPEESLSFCAPLAALAVKEIRQAHGLPAVDIPEAIFVTESAGRLPGLVPALQEWIEEQAPVMVLPPNAVARAAHELAVRVSERSVPADHLATVLPLAQKAKPELLIQKKRRISVFE
jgi:molecular chaperone DnaK (HSP70)